MTDRITFLSTEVAMQEKLKQHLASSSESDGKTTIINFVCNDTDVQFHWSILSHEI